MSENDMPQSHEEILKMMEEAKKDPNFLPDLTARLGDELLTILTVAEQFEIDLDKALEEASKRTHDQMHTEDCDSCD